MSISSTPFDAWAFIDTFEVERDPNIFSGSCWVIKGTRMPVSTFMECLIEKINAQVRLVEKISDYHSPEIDFGPPVGKEFGSPEWLILNPEDAKK